MREFQNHPCVVFTEGTITHAVVLIQLFPTEIPGRINVPACEAMSVVFAEVGLPVCAFNALIALGTESITFFVVMLVAIGLVIQHIKYLGAQIFRTR